MKPTSGWRRPGVVAIAVLFALGLLGGCLWLIRSTSIGEAGSVSTEEREPRSGADGPDLAVAEHEEGARASIRSIEGARPDREATEAAPTSQSVLLRVEDQAGAAISAAVVYARIPAGDCERLGQTGEDGEFLVVVGDSPPERLVVCKADFVQVDWKLPHELPNEHRVVMTRGLTIEGQVVRSDGASLDEGTVVVAIPMARVPHVAGFEAILNPGVDVSRAETTADGSFSVQGLEPGRRYELVAGSLGWVTTERTIATAGDTAVTLEVFATYGVRVRLRGEQDEPLETSLSFSYTDYFGTKFLDPESVVPMQRSLELSLAGLDPRELEFRPHESVFFLAGPKDLPNLLSMGLHINVPGYRSVDDAVPLPRCLGELKVHEFSLRREASAWTDLTIEMRGTPWGGVRETGAFKSEMSLRVLDPSGQWGTLSFSPGKSTHRLPVGLYEFDLGLQMGGWNRSRRDLRKVELRGPEDTLVYDFPSGLGALELNLLDRDGWTAHGPATLFYRRAGETGGSRVLAFLHAPYRLGAFPSGEWDMFVTTGYGTAVRGVKPEQYTRVSVPEGEVAHARLRSL